MRAKPHTASLERREAGHNQEPDHVQAIFRAFSGEVGPGSPQKMRLLKEN
jgi:hypothetical protein